MSKSKWRVVGTHRGTVKAGGKYHGPGDFIAYTKQLEDAGLIEPVEEKKADKGKKVKNEKAK